MVALLIMNKSDFWIQILKTHDECLCVYLALNKFCLSINRHMYTNYNEKYTSILVK